eukprot:TRINITY_DN30395_c0_g2_i1.p1 TRINITY_DN30395_c0_g2~~TRINITY_DN30395_c0_g2_i1.p1  ORF type:complete len:1707 (-),score=270.07 TRINITY_DN30395_c0_g2_i1:154-5274(-)
MVAGVALPLLLVLLLWAAPSVGTDEEWTWNPAPNFNACVDSRYYWTHVLLEIAALNTHGYGSSCVTSTKLSCSPYCGDWSTRTYVENVAACMEFCMVDNTETCKGIEYNNHTGKCAIIDEQIISAHSDASLTNRSCYKVTERFCADWSGQNCSDAGNFGLTSSQVQTLKDSCPRSCADVLVSEECRDPPLRVVQVAKLNDDLGKDRQQRWYEDEAALETLNVNLYFNQAMESPGLLVEGFPITLDLAAVSIDTGLDQRMAYLMERKQANVILGAYPKFTLQGICKKAGEANALMLLPFSGEEQVIGSQPSIFSMGRPYSKLLLPAFLELAKHGRKHGFSSLTVLAICPGAQRRDYAFYESDLCDAMPATVAAANLTFLRHSSIDVPIRFTTGQMGPAIQRLGDEVAKAAPDIVVCVEELRPLCFNTITILRRIDYDPKAIIYVESPADERTSMWITAASTHRVGDYQKLMAMMVSEINHQDLQKAHEILRDVIIVSQWDRSPAESLSEAAPMAGAWKYAVEAWEQKNQMTVTPLGAAAWAAAFVAATAMQATASLQTDKLAKYIRHMDNETIYGRLKFDGDGMLTGAASTMQVQLWPNTNSSEVRSAAPGEPLDGTGLPRLSFVTPLGKPLSEDLLFPRRTWKEQNCLNEMTYPMPAPGLPPATYRHGFDENGVCRPCQGEKLSVWNQSEGKRRCMACPLGQQLYRDPEQGDVCTQCVMGKVGEMRGSGSGQDADVGNTCKFCKPGSFSNRDGATACQTCEAGRFAPSEGATECVACSVLFGSGTPASRTFWSLAGSNICTACPKGALCTPDKNGLYSRYTNDAGYYFFNESFADAGKSYGLYECRHGRGKACLANNSCYRDAEGVLAMHGPMCGSCMPGFAKPILVPDSLCDACPSVGVAVAGVLLQAIAMSTTIGILTLLHYFTDYSKPKPIRPVLLKQVVNYFILGSIVTSLIGDHGIYGDASMQTIGVFMTFWNGDWASRASSCVMNHMLRQEQQFKFVTLLGILWYPIVTAVSYVAFRVIALARRLSQKSPMQKRHWMAWMVLTCYLTLPFVSRLIATNFNCEFWDRSRLIFDPHVVCSDIWGWQVISGLGLLTIPVGIPVLAAFMLRRLQAKDLLRTYNVSKIYGFLYTGFESQFCYWECVLVLRNILFQVVPNLPGLATADENARGMVQHSGLVVVATVFFNMHLAAQPYDNRCNYLLDRIERAMLRAIVVTLLLQTFALATNYSDAFHVHSRNRSLRGWVCFVITLAFHLRFWGLVFWGFFYHQLRTNLGQWPRLAALFLDPGTIEVTADGLVATDLNREQERFFSDIIAEVVKLHRGSEQRIDFDSVTTSLQMICVEGLRSRLKAELENVDYFETKMQQAQDIVETCISDGAFKNMLLRYLNFVERMYRVMSTTDEDCSERERERRKLRRINQKKKEIQELESFSEVSWSKVFTHKFTVQELHMAMLSTCNRIRDERLARRVAIRQKQKGEEHRNSVACVEPEEEEKGKEEQEEEKTQTETEQVELCSDSLEKELRALQEDNEALTAKLMELENLESVTAQESTSPGDEESGCSRVVHEVHDDVPDAPHESNAGSLLAEEVFSAGSDEAQKGTANSGNETIDTGPVVAALNDHLSTLQDMIQAVKVELQEAEKSARLKQESSKAELQKAEQELQEAANQKKLIAAEVEAASKELRDDEILLKKLEAVIAQRKGLSAT